MKLPACVAILIAISGSLASARPVLATAQCVLAAATCGENRLTCACLGAGTPVVSTAPAQRCAGTWKAGDPCDGACYDLRLGLLQVVANRSLSCTDQVETVDAYALVDAPLESVSCFAELHVTGTLSGSATALAFVGTDPMNYAVGEYDGADSPVDERLVIPVHYGPYDPYPNFLLGMTLGAALGATPGMADLTATLEFAGLPEGVTVTSCQGYTMPVPTVPSTWARVKATYR